MEYTTNEYVIPQSTATHNWCYNNWVASHIGHNWNLGYDEELSGLPSITGLDEFVEGISEVGIDKPKIKFEIRYKDEEIDVGPYKVKMDKIIKDIKMEMDNLKENKDTIFAYRILKVALEDIEAKYKNALEFKKAKIKKEIKV